MKKIVLILCAALALTGIIVSTASADRAVVSEALFGGKPVECPMKEDSNLNINFNSNETDLLKIKPMMESKIGEINQMASQAGIKLEMTSMNYSVNANNPGGGCVTPTASVYQVYGNLSFRADPGEKATALMQSLIEKGYNANLNVNSYRQCQ